VSDPVDRFVAEERALHDAGCSYPDEDCSCGHSPDADDPRPCKGRNANVCVAEGCYGEACVDLALRAIPSDKGDA
jgi:hypothetical protein